MAASVKLPSFGIEVVEGRPGSGKSFWGVTKVLDAIVHERRPVYTNLPIRFRVMRAWLRRRHGEKLASLIRPLTREHFVAFLDRQKKRNAFFERHRTAGMREPEIKAKWYAEAGADDLAANWIPSMSLIIIDEVHHWYPMSGQRAEDPNLLAYTTMIRHHLQHLIVISQDRMQISLTFRRLAQFFWQVRNRADDKVAWGIRLRHFGVSAFAYEKYAPENEEARGGDMAAPLECYTAFPWWPTEKFKFRLYDSFTHMGGQRELRRQLREARVMAGLDEDGITAPQPGVKDMGKKLRTIAVGGLVACGMFVAFGIGRALAPAVKSQTAATASAKWTPPRLGGFVGGAPILDGTRVAVGGRHNGADVVFADQRKSLVFIHRNDNVWLLRMGRSGENLGRVGEVKDSVRRVFNLGGTASGRTDAAPTVRGPQAVGPSGG